jgi:hypothetical protein
MTIHTALVAEQSPTLRNLVVGFMEEAQTGTAVWEDTDEGTFARFAQFVYTGDYTQPPCNVVENSRTVSLKDEPTRRPPPAPLKHSPQKSRSPNRTWACPPNQID